MTTQEIESGAKPRTFKNPRRAALARLAEIRDGVKWIINSLTVTSTVYEPVTKTYTEQHTGAVREYQDSNPRPRRYEEYPENKPANWSALYAEADRLVALASELRQFAAEEYHKTVARNAERAQ